MITLYQGETLTFSLSGEDLSGYEVRAALRPSGASFRRDCTCGKAIVTWDSKDIEIDTDTAVWVLTTEQSANIPVGKYAVEVALRDINSKQDIKETTEIAIIEVIPSYTR